MNNRGVVVETVLIYVLAATILLFVPNPVSTATGIGVRPNKTVQTEKVELIKDKEGNPIALRTIIRHDDIQQKATLWEWLGSLPIFVLILMVLGGIFPPVAAILLRLRGVWKSAFKNQYNGLKNLEDKTVICRKCGDAVTIDTKEFVFDNVEKKLDVRDKVLQERVRTELTK